jgi:sugar/nucleoside kinase (ribokinase family)
VHLGPVHGEDLAESALAVVAESASLITLDVQGLIRAPRLGPVEVEISSLFAPCLAAASIVKADYVELRTILDALGQSQRDSLEAFRIDELVVTMGARGGYVATGDGRTVHYEAVPASSLHDTTGAGDVFFAAYVAERVYRGAPIEQACTRAAAVASQQVAGTFIQPGQLAL